MCAWTWNGNPAFCPARFTSQLKESVVNGPPRSLTNTNGDFGASRFSFRSARNSSPRIGCVLGFPFLTRCTCKLAALKSICSQRRSTISDARRPCLRASEIVDLRWEQIDFSAANLHVHRVKNGKPSTHPIRGDELRALRKLKREAPKSPFVFVSERGGPFTTDSFNWLVKRAGQKANLPFQVYAQMLRHAAGFKLAGDGHDTRSIQDYLGHKNIQHTVRYTELSPTRFKDFWRD